MMLCGLRVLLKFLFGRVVGLMSSQRGFEYWQLLVRLETSEALGRFQHTGSGPTQRHGGIAPSLHVATNTAHGAHHVFDRVGTGERAPELRWSTEAVDG